MARVAYQKLEDHSPLFWGLLALNVVIILAGLGAAYVMEHRGHIVTGMNNQVVWGAPHVFAVFLIVAASGVLNAASVSSVFDRPAYKPYARLSGLLAIALLIGGLAVLVLDLGRPDRLIVYERLNDAVIRSPGRADHEGVPPAPREVELESDPAADPTLGEELRVPAPATRIKLRKLYPTLPT